LCFTATGSFDPERLARIVLKIGPRKDEAAEAKPDRKRAYDCVDELSTALRSPRFWQSRWLGRATELARCTDAARR
jgi:hypothetical protein